MQVNKIPQQKQRELTQYSSVLSARLPLFLLWDFYVLVTGGLVTRDWELVAGD